MPCWTFRSEEGEAILLPDQIAFGADAEVVIFRSGDVMTIYPVRESIAEMIARLRALPTPPAIEIRGVETSD